MIMESTRQKKVARLVQKELADIILRKGHEIAPGKMISVTQVRISPDLSLAKAYISIFPAHNKDEVLEEIRDTSKSIRYDLGIKVKSQLRIVPELAFYMDDSLDYIDNLDKLLKS
jgi:ribosome-binding factor A